MVSEITILMSKEISDRFLSFMDDKDKTGFETKVFYFEIVVEMKKCFKEIDNKIANLVGIK